MTVVLVLLETKKLPGTDGNPRYRALLNQMHAILESLPGYISTLDFPGRDGSEVNLVRFESLEALEAWRNHPEHQAAQREGRRDFYDWYRVEVFTSVRDYSFDRNHSSQQP